jgi:UDP:flavonoid glycosyltransferase YjiC (YdhE family)
MADPETADLLSRALANPYAGNRAIAEALDERGHTVTMASLRRHRRRECRCDA